MFSDADAELDRIDPFNRAAPEVLAVRIAIYHGLKKWEAMREIAKRLADFDPKDVQWIICMPTQPEELNQLRQPRKFSSLRRQNSLKRQLLNTISLAISVRQKTWKLQRII